MRALIVSVLLIAAIYNSPRLEQNQQVENQEAENQEAAEKSPLDLVIDREATINKIRPSLIRAIIVIESHGDCSAKSHTADHGIMQINIEHMNHFGYSQDDLYNCELNVIAGARLYREELDRFGNEFDALRAYNCGSPKAKRNKLCGHHYARKVQRAERVLLGEGEV